MTPREAAGALEALWPGGPPFECLRELERWYHHAWGLADEIAHAVDAHRADTYEALCAAVDRIRG